MSSGNYTDFLTALGQNESGNNYSYVSSLGYLGRYQFAEEALTDVGLYVPDGSGGNTDFVGSFTSMAASTYGVTDKASFLASTAAQDYAVGAWFNKIAADVKALGLEKYVGQNVGGVEITTSGMLAGAHLVGVWNLKAFLESGGSVVAQDGYGATVASYLSKFGGYDVPFALGDGASTPAAVAPAAPSEPAAGGGSDGATAVADAGTAAPPAGGEAAVAIAGGERHAEGSDFTFTITRSGDTSGRALVDYFTWSENADAADFSGPTAGTAYFEPGAAEAVVHLRAAPDDAPEGEELFHLALSNPRGVTITEAQADGWILA